MPDPIQGATPRKPRPQPAIPFVTPIHGLLLNFQAELQRLESEIEEAKAQAQLAMVNPRPGGAAEESATNGVSSFGFAGFYEYEAGKWSMKLYGGYVNYSRHLHDEVPDTPDEKPGVSPFSPPQITGTVSAPCVIYLEMNKSDNSLKYVSMPTEQADSDSYWYYALHTAYLDNAGLPVYVKDRRSDWRMGSPIG